MAKDFLPKVITWFRLDEHVRRLKEFVDSLTTRVETLENAPSGGVQSVSGDLVNNDDALNPEISTPTLQQVTAEGNETTDSIKTVNLFNPDKFALVSDGGVSVNDYTSNGGSSLNQGFIQVVTAAPDLKAFNIRGTLGALGDITQELTPIGGTIPVLNLIAPVAANSPGRVGQVIVTPTFIYYCVATDTWVRSVAATW